MGDVTTSAGRNIDTVQELTDILIASENGLMDRGSGLGNRLDVDTTDDDLILNVGGTEDSAALEHGDLTDLTLSKEVTNLNSVSELGLLVLVGDSQVDGEMVVDETHLVGVTLGDSDDHVADVRNDGANASQLLLGSPPHFHLKAALTDLGDVQLKVLEGLGQLSERASDDDNARGNVDSHYCLFKFNSISKQKSTRSVFEIFAVGGRNGPTDCSNIVRRLFSFLFTLRTILRNDDDLVGHESLHT